MQPVSALTGGPPLGLQSVHRLVHVVLGQIQAEGLTHLDFCLASGAGTGHGQRDANAARREEQVLIAGREGPIEIEGESIVSNDRFVDVHQRLP